MFVADVLVKLKGLSLFVGFFVCLILAQLKAQLLSLLGSFANPQIVSDEDIDEDPG